MVITGGMSDFDAYRAIRTHENQTQRLQAQGRHRTGAKAGEVDASVLLNKYMANHYLNVSNANGNFSTGVFYWKQTALTYVHYIAGIRLCSNDITKYRLALYYLYGQAYVLIHALQLKRLAEAIELRSTKTEVI